MSSVRASVLSTASVILLVALSGCGSAQKTESTSPETASATSNSATPSELASSTSSPSPSISPSPEPTPEPTTEQASPTEEPTATEPPLPEAIVPEGYKVISSQANAVSFAVPQHWVEFHAQQTPEEINTIIAQLPATMNLNAGQISGFLTELDLISAAPQAGEEAVNVNIQVPDTTVVGGVSEELARQHTADSKGTFVSFAEKDSPVGKVQQVAYTTVTPSTGATLYGVFVFVPVLNGEATSIVTATASTPEKVQQVADEITASFQKL